MNTYSYTIRGWDDIYAPIIHTGRIQARDENEARSVLRLNLRNQETLELRCV